MISCSATARPPAAVVRALGIGTLFETITRRAIVPPPYPATRRERVCGKVPHSSPGGVHVLQQKGRHDRDAPANCCAVRPLPGGSPHSPAHPCTKTCK